MDTLSLQVQAFLLVILAGLTCGILFDLYRVIRGLVRMQGFATTVTDIIFWLFVTPTLLVYLLLANWLELRLYVFLGISLGLFLYFMVFSGLVLQLLAWLSRVIWHIVSGLLRVVLFVVLSPFALGSHLYYRFRSPGSYRPRAGFWRAPLKWRRRFSFPAVWWRQLTRRI